LDEVEPDGQVTLQTALDAFALAVGPVPGAVATVGTRSLIASGTIAVDWVLGYWGDLSPTQQDAVLADLGTPTTAADAPYGQPHPAGARLLMSDDLGNTRVQTDGAPQPDPNIACQTSDIGNVAPYRAQIPGILAAIRSHLGQVLLPEDFSIYLAANTLNLASTALLYTVPCNGAQNITGPVTGCTIHINPRVVGATQDIIYDALIHELMHCVYFQRFGYDDDKIPAWFDEGSAEWAASVLGVGDSVMSGFWGTYLLTIDIPLFMRTDSALGFFAHLAETGTDVWGELIGVAALLVSTGSNDMAWMAMVTHSFLETWGSGYSEGRAPGVPWNARGPNLPVYWPILPIATVTDNGSATLSSLATATMIKQIHVDAQVVLAQWGAGSDGLISLGGGSDASPAQASTPLCGLSGGCVCPSGSPQAGTQFGSIESGTEYAAVTGGLNAGSLKLAGMTLEDYCGKPPPPVSCGVLPRLGPTGSELRSDISTAYLTGTELVCAYDDFATDDINNFQGSIYVYTSPTAKAAKALYGSFTAAPLVGLGYPAESDGVTCEEGDNSSDCYHVIYDFALKGDRVDELDMGGCRRHQRRCRHRSAGHDTRQYIASQ